MTLSYSVVLKATQLDQITTRAGNASRLAIYSGTRPAAGASIGASVLLATFVMGTPFAPPASQVTGGPLLPTLPPAVAVGVSGLASWYRHTQADGVTFVMDGDVSTIAANTGDLQISDTNLVASGTLTMSSSSIVSGN